MKNILIAFLFLFSSNCFAQNNIDTTNLIDFKFQDDYILAAPSLYLKCRNDVYFSLSDNTDFEKLSFEVKGGDLVIQDSSKFVSLIPTASKTTLTIFFEGKEIAEQIFKVKLIPKPTIKLEQLSGKALIEFPKKLNVSVSADETFKNDLPNDANYEIEEYKAVLVMGKQIIAEKLVREDQYFTAEEVEKYTKLIEAEPKESWRLVVIVNGIQRINYNNEIEKIPVGYWGQGDVFTLPIELKD